MNFPENTTLERLLDRLLLAGWLHSHAFAKNKGALDLTKKGFENMASLAKSLNSLEGLTSKEMPVLLDLVRAFGKSKEKE